MNEWKNMGDINFVDYGGVMVKRDDERPNDYHFFKLDIGKDKYAYSGTVCDIYDYADTEVIKELSREMGYDDNDVESFIKNHPEQTVVELVTNYGYGSLEFGSRNCKGVGQYSLDSKDFMLSHNELVAFMEKLNIPEGYIPEWQVDFENAKLVGKGDCYLTDENEKVYSVKIELPTNRDYCELYRKIFVISTFSEEEFKKAQEEKGLIVTTTLAVESDEPCIEMCCSSPYTLSNIYNVTELLSNEEYDSVKALCNKDETIEFFDNLKAEFEINDNEKD